MLCWKHSLRAKRTALQSRARFSLHSEEATAALAVVLATGRGTASHAGTLCLLAGRKASAGRQAGPSISSAVSSVSTVGVKGAACRLAATQLPQVARLPVTPGGAERNQKMMLHHAQGPHGCCSGPDHGRSRGMDRREARLVVDPQGMGAVDLQALQMGQALVAFCGMCHRASARCH